jgi:uncharacterized protein YheU (UPF0270 family)
MQIPVELLSTSALRAIIAEFVTRDGTDHSSVAAGIDGVMRQLAEGRAEVHFDSETETCNIVIVNERSAGVDAGE